MVFVEVGLGGWVEPGVGVGWRVGGEVGKGAGKGEERAWGAFALDEEVAVEVAGGAEVGWVDKGDNLAVHGRAERKEGVVWCVLYDDV